MGEPPFDSGRGRGRRHAVLLVALTLVALLPFAAKPFHIDDPLFVWAAKQIQREPLDPYGFTVNWYGVPMRMADVTKNPPLASYYIAGVASLSGLREVPLHLAFLVPALGVVLFTYLLGRRFTGRPLLGALIVLATPVFLISSTSVMCDVWMLALWLASVWLWVRGVDTGSRAKLLAAAGAAALAALMKYFALALVPLLLAYTWMRRGRPGPAWPLLIPVAVAAAYHAGTKELYGRGLLLDAVSYSTGARTLLGSGGTPLTGLAFTGGCIGAALLIALLGCRRRAAALWLSLAVVGTLAVALAGGGISPESPGTGGPQPALHLGIFATMGIAVLALAAADLRARRDADSMLLVLWVGGTFVFAALLNWSTNGRSILPMAPALGLLIARSLGSARGKTHTPRARKGPEAAILAGAGLLAWWIASADVRDADGARRAAHLVRDRAAGATGRLLFQGHWGFQYYLEALGGVPLDRSMRLFPGDLLVLPENNTNVDVLPQPWMRLVDTVEIPAGTGVAVNRIDRGAGFYSDVFGPVPYVFGPVPPDRYAVYEIFDPAAP